jgi:type IV secretion system protein VirB10
MRNATTLLLLASVVCAQDPDRNFTGIWDLDSESSQPRGLPVPPARTLQIQHEGESIGCSVQPVENAENDCSHNTDGTIRRVELRGLTISSKTKWEGRALLINAIVSGSKNYTRMDRWILSRDRNTLRIRREIVGSHGTREATLVYTRRGASRPAEAKKEDTPARPPEYRVAAGTRIPLKLVNTLSTKNSGPGDRIYLETAFPALSEGRIVIPRGSFVAGTLTNVTRPGRAKGRGQLYLRFDSLTLPNGVTRDFRARPGSVDADATGKIDRQEGRIEGEGSEAEDARKVGEATAAGASVGGIAGAVSGHTGMGIGLGAAGGAAAGLFGILLSRGPDIVLEAGTVFEMVLDRDLRFQATEVNFGATGRQ